MDGRFANYSSGSDSYTGAVDDTQVSVTENEEQPFAERPLTDRQSTEIAFSEIENWINPVEGPVTSLFGPRINPVTQSSEFHNGIDIAVPIGTPVLAVRYAVVFHVGENDLNGKYMRLLCNTGYEIIFAHLSEVLVTENERVAQGQKIAYSGNSGRSTGPHLHYGLLRDGQMLDPLRRVDLTLSYHAAKEYAARTP
jgi:murein DD-endopeptidase MepM/ murein hydrolase activator NlpD